MEAKSVYRNKIVIPFGVTPITRSRYHSVCPVTHSEPVNVTLLGQNVSQYVRVLGREKYFIAANVNL